MADRGEVLAEMGEAGVPFQRRAEIQSERGAEPASGSPPLLSPSVRTLGPARLVIRGPSVLEALSAAFGIALRPTSSAGSPDREP